MKRLGSNVSDFRIASWCACDSMEICDFQMIYYIFYIHSRGLKKGMLIFVFIFWFICTKLKLDTNEGLRHLL